VTQAETAIATLQQQGATTVIIKLGEQGVLCGTADDTFHIPAFAVTVVDTVAAGDAFNGGLAVALSDGQPLRNAVVWASATAALAVTKPGAQPAEYSKEKRILNWGWGGFSWMLDGPSSPLEQNPPRRQDIYFVGLLLMDSRGSGSLSPTLTPNSTSWN
jgi:hypothetical protein